MSDTNTNTSTTAAVDPVEVNLIEADPQPEPEPQPELSADEGATESELDSDGDGESEFETVDLAESELYQVLSLFLNRTPAEDADEDEPTENITDVLAGLKESVDTLNGLLQNAVSTMTSASAAAQQKRSGSSLRRHRTSTRSTKH